MTMRVRSSVVAAVLMASVLPAVTERVSGQSGVQRAIQESRESTVEFGVTQGTNCLNPGSSDQITIVFSNQAAENLSPAAPVLGEDVVAEFSFSAGDIVHDRLMFRRMVRDRSFLDARFIRVVNLNGNGWCGGQLSLAIDGRQLLDKVSLSDRVGKAPGIQDWNREHWAKKSYWQKNLQELLRPARKQ
jgi:hypothetical protein